MQNVEFQVEGDQLVIVVDLSQELGESASGKSVIIATTGGNVAVPGVICRNSWPPGPAYASLTDRHFILHKRYSSRHHRSTDMSLNRQNLLVSFPAVLMVA